MKKSIHWSLAFGAASAILVLTQTQVRAAESPEALEIAMNSTLQQIKDVQGACNDCKTPHQVRVIELATRVFAKEFKNLDFDQATALAQKKWPGQTHIGYEPVKIVSFEKFSATAEYKRYAKAHPNEVSEEALYGAEAVNDQKQDATARKQKLEALQTSFSQLSEQYSDQSRIRTAQILEKTDRMPADSKK